MGSTLDVAVRTVTGTGEQLSDGCKRHDCLSFFSDVSILGLSFTFSFPVSQTLDQDLSLGGKGDNIPLRAKVAR